MGFRQLFSDGGPASHFMVNCQNIGGHVWIEVQEDGQIRMVQRPPSVKLVDGNS
jgi:hypothetical protein